MKSGIGVCALPIVREVYGFHLGYILVNDLYDLLHTESSAQWCVHRLAKEGPVGVKGFHVKSLVGWVVTLAHDSLYLFYRVVVDHHGRGRRWVSPVKRMSKTYLYIYTGTQL